MFNVTPIDFIGMIVAAAALISLSLWAQRFHKSPSDIIGKRKIFFVVSGVLVAVSICSMVFKGFQFGMDFTGGTLMEIGFVQNQDKITSEQVAREIMAYSREQGLDLLEPQVQVEENAVNAREPYRKVIIRLSKKQSTDVTTAEVQGIADDLERTLGELYHQPKTTVEGAGAEPAPAESASPAPTTLKGTHKSLPPSSAAAAAGTTTILQRETIDPIIGHELFTNALFALLVALVLQLLYITFRFGLQIRYGVAADIALVHDVIIMAGLYSLTNRQVDSPFLAALLTVIGYSVMDSIVVFDRIRENVRHSRKGVYESICNASLNQTMTRSVNTTLTVLITLFALYFFGGDTLRNFAFALLVGITSGAYSSIFVATPLVVILDQWTKQREEVRVAERRAEREAARERAEAERRPTARPTPGGGSEAGYQPRRRSTDANPLNEDYPDVEELETDSGGRRVPADRHRRRRPTRRPRK